MNFPSRIKYLSSVLIENYSLWQPAFGSDATPHCTSPTGKIEVVPFVKYSQSGNSLVSFQKSHFCSGIKGRKLQQITDFISSIRGEFDAKTPTPLFDYCCGKAHLSRLASQVLNISKIHGVEFDMSLVTQAQSLCEQQGLAHDIHCDDALKRNYQLPKSGHILAMHACGELHTTLLEEAVQQKVTHISLSPCCYHKRFNTPYQPLSKIARATGLNLNNHNIKLAVRGATTSSQGERTAFHTLRTLRLVFDSYCREFLKCDYYTPLPSLPLSAARLSISEFIKQACELKNLPLLALSQIEIEHLKTAGKERYQAELHREETSQQFQPLLEEWIVLDLALFLEEHNYAVDITRFCDPRVTPRNYLLKAKYKS